MDSLVQNLTTYILIGAIISIAVAQVNRALGGAIGVALWVFVAFVGHHGYQMGGYAIGIGSFQFSAGLFYGICGLFAALNAATIFAAWRKRRPAKFEDE